jgi:DNA-directed RNA polymerase specialized sigma24 family protein
MESVKELYKQLKKLSLTISQCNFISAEDKKDLIQDTIVSLYEKLKEGKISDDFNDIKGYSFISLRNKCVGFKRKNKPEYTDAVVEELGNIIEVDLDKEEHNLYLHGLIKHYIQHDKYTHLQKETCRLLLDNKDNKEIADELNIPGDEVAKLKFNIKNRMKADARRKILYVVKNKYNKNLQYPCYTRADIGYFFKGLFTPRQVSSMIYEGFVAFDGHYIVRIFEKEKIN